MVGEHQASVVFPDLLFRKRALAKVEDQAGFSAAHLLLEAAFVERSAQRVEPVRVAVSPECD